MTIRTAKRALQAYINIGFMIILGLALAIVPHAAHAATLPQPTSSQPGPMVVGPNFDVTWSAVAGATGYNFRSSTNEGSGGLLTTPFEEDDDTATNPEPYDMSDPMLVKRSQVGYADGTYYWQVQATDDIGNTSAWSEIYSVTVDATSPASPVQTLPVDGATVTTHTPTLQWGVVSDATRYEVRLSAEGSSIGGGQQDRLASGAELNGSDAQNYESASPSYQTVALADGDYYWQVRSLDTVGNVSAWSSIHSFTVDTTPPVIAIFPLVYTTSPKPPFNGSVTGDAEYTLTVTIDGIAAIVTINGSAWTAVPSVALEPGTHVLEAVAQDASGNRSNRLSDSMTFEISAAMVVPTGSSDELAPIDNSALQPDSTLVTIFGTNDMTSNLMDEDETTATNSETEVPTSTTPFSTPAGANQTEEATNGAWRVAGVAWYWWAGIVLVGALLLSMMIKRFRAR